MVYPDRIPEVCLLAVAVWSSSVARRAHNPEVARFKSGHRHMHRSGSFSCGPPLPLADERRVGMWPESARTVGSGHARSSGVIVSRVTAAEAAKLLGIDRHLIYVWRASGKLEPAGKRGRSPLYRWCDLVQVERDTRTSGRSYRGSRESVA